MLLGCRIILLANLPILQLGNSPPSILLLEDYSVHVSSYGGNSRIGGYVVKSRGTANEFRAWSMKKANERSNQQTKSWKVAK
ncbi:hypothetical protein P5V15_014620 [Pogonomyrmex californicus]